MILAVEKELRVEAGIILACPGCRYAVIIKIKYTNEMAVTYNFYLIIFL